MASSSVTGPSKSLYDATDAFCKAYPNVKVTIQPTQGSTASVVDKYTTAALSGAGPDIVTLDSSGYVIDCAAMGTLLPIGKRLGSLKDRYVQGSLNSGKYQGDYYAVPLYYNNCAIYYNKKILSDAGVKAVPATWSEFEDAVAKVTGIGKKAVITQLNSYALYNFFFENGNPVIDSSGKKPVVTVNNETGKEAWDFYCNIQVKYNGFPEAYKEALSWDKAYAPFLQGDVAFLVCGDWAYNTLKTGNPNLDFGIAPMPKNKQAGTVLGGLMLGINKNTKYPDAAFAYLKWLTDKEQDYVMYDLGRIPARTDVDTNVVLGKNPMLKPFFDQAASTMPRPTVVNLKDVDSAIIDSFKQVLYNQMTPDKALSSLSDKLNQIINDNYK